MASIAITVMGASKVNIHKLEKHSGVGEWRQATVFNNWLDDAMDQLHIANLDPGSNVGNVWLGWHLEEEAKILHSTFKKNPATKDLGVTHFLTELRQFCIPFINEDQLWTEFQAIKQTHEGRSMPI